MTTLYNPDKTKIIGHVIDGRIVPLSPAPTGDAFDDFWDICCRAVEKHPRLKAKLDGTLTPDISTGKHSSWLIEEVTVWIQEGDLRDFQQVNRAISSYADHWDRLVRVEAVKEWKLERWSFWNSIKSLRWFFGVPGSKPLPSKTEVLEEQARWEVKESERIRLANIARLEENELRAKWDAEFALKARIKGIIKKVADKLYSYDRINFDRDGVESDPRYRDLAGKRKIFRLLATDEVQSRIERGMTDEMILEEMIMSTLEALKAEGLSEIPPLEEGQTRCYFTPSEWQKFMASGEWDAVLDSFDTVLMKGSDDGLFVLDIVPKTPLTEAQKAALAEHAEKSKQVGVKSSESGSHAA